MGKNNNIQKQKSKSILVIKMFIQKMNILFKQHLVQEQCKQLINIMILIKKHLITGGLIINKTQQDSDVLHIQHKQRKLIQIYLNQLEVLNTITINVKSLNDQSVLRIQINKNIKLLQNIFQQIMRQESNYLKSKIRKAYLQSSSSDSQSMQSHRISVQSFVEIQPNQNLKIHQTYDKNKLQHSHQNQQGRKIQQINIPDIKNYRSKCSEYQIFIEPSYYQIEIDCPKYYKRKIRTLNKLDPSIQLEQNNNKSKGENIQQAQNIKTIRYKYKIDKNSNEEVNQRKINETSSLYSTQKIANPQQSEIQKLSQINKKPKTNQYHKRCQSDQLEIFQCRQILNQLCFKDDSYQKIKQFSYEYKSINNLKIQKDNSNSKESYQSIQKLRKTKNILAQGSQIDKY